MVTIVNRYSAFSMETEANTPINRENGANRKRKELASSPNSPQENVEKRQGILSNDSPTETNHTGNLTHSQIENEQPSISHETSNTEPNPDNEWHIVIRALSNEPIQTKSLDNAISKICPNVMIIKSMKTKSQQCIFYKMENPIAAFNSLYKHRVALCQAMKTTLTLDPWTNNPVHSNRVTFAPKHVIVREVPIDYTEEEIRNRLDPEINKDITSIGRIKGLNGKAAPLIRIICSTEDLAKSLISNGLLLGNRKLAVEAAKPQYNPLRCYNCSRYGHHSSTCQNEQCCAFCGYGHRTTQCENKNNLAEHYCINCNSTAHNSRDRNCPVHLEEVRKLRETERLRNQRILEKNNAIPTIVKRGNAWTPSTQNKFNISGHDSHKQEITDMKLAIIECVDSAKQTIENTIIEKNKTTNEELKLEIEMNRSGYTSLLETNKLALKELFDDFRSNIEKQVHNLIDEAHKQLIEEVNKLIVKQQTDFLEQNQKAIYHQMKNALSSHYKVQGTQKTEGQTQRVQSTPPFGRTNIQFDTTIQPAKPTPMNQNSKSASNEVQRK